MFWHNCEYQFPGKVVSIKLFLEFTLVICLCLVIEYPQLSSTSIYYHMCTPIMHGVFAEYLLR